MAQDEEEFPAHTEVCKGNPDEVLRHWGRKSDDSDLISASPDFRISLRAAGGPWGGKIFGERWL